MATGRWQVGLSLRGASRQSAPLRSPQRAAPTMRRLGRLQLALAFCLSAAAPPQPGETFTLQATAPVLPAGVSPTLLAPGQGPPDRRAPESLSVEGRIRYYMGQWYTRHTSVRASAYSQRALMDTPFLFNRSTNLANDGSACRNLADSDSRYRFLRGTCTNYEDDLADFARRSGLDRFGVLVMFGDDAVAAERDDASRPPVLCKSRALPAPGVRPRRGVRQPVGHSLQDERPPTLGVAHDAEARGAGVGRQARRPRLARQPHGPRQRPERAVRVRQRALRSPTSDSTTASRAARSGPSRRPSASAGAPHGGTAQVPVRRRATRAHACAQFARAILRAVLTARPSLYAGTTSRSRGTTSRPTSSGSSRAARSC